MFMAGERLTSLAVFFIKNVIASNLNVSAAVKTFAQAKAWKGTFQ
jgi:hypothetical protein